MRDHALRDRSGTATRGHHHRDAAGGGRLEVDQVGAHSGTGEHAHPRCAVEERLVDHRVGAHDRTLRDGQIGIGGLGDERDVAEHTGDQVGLDLAETHGQRAGSGGHCPAPAPAGSPP